MLVGQGGKHSDEHLNHLRYQQVWLVALVGYATHGLLDACTTYGTMLLWPFSDARIAWSNI
ncbi:metal-dependent hydrolase, partial [Luminiphilus sp.]|nr:metal-dependent hydrolase [Luminiphilus sp.]